MLVKISVRRYVVSLSLCPTPHDGRVPLQVVDPVLSTRGHSATGGFANVNLVSGSETPVDEFPPNGKGFHDLFGNAWEW